MSLHLRQVALVARDLDQVVDDLCAVFDLAVGYNDPAIGSLQLHNAVIPVGEEFLEVVAPLVEASRPIDSSIVAVETGATC
ncbi:MAG: hypothetical protein R2710_24945 [Acidimicrobiales bacterium]